MKKYHWLINPWHSIKDIKKRLDDNGDEGIRIIRLIVPKWIGFNLTFCFLWQYVDEKVIFHVELSEIENSS